ncbi:OmpA family protein [Echinicola vietnamensis]|uniref:OmpA family protein n=1 Tax=Echinicola vietnamensis TaxID=390884 RepID=UPI0005A17682|nr:OmpA family protein [Echinicola vietnamensis]
MTANCRANLKIPVPNLIFLGGETTVVYFDFDKASLRPKSVHDLDKIAILLQVHDEFTIEVVGHTDIRGVKVVKDFLLNQGIEEGKIS